MRACELLVGAVVDDVLRLPGTDQPLGVTLGLFETDAEGEVGLEVGVLATPAAWAITGGDGGSKCARAANRFGVSMAAAVRSRAAATAFAATTSLWILATL